MLVAELAALNDSAFEPRRSLSRNGTTIDYSRKVCNSMASDLQTSPLCADNIAESCDTLCMWLRRLCLRSTLSRHKCSFPKQVKLELAMELTVSRGARVHVMQQFNKRNTAIVAPGFCMCGILKAQVRSALCMCSLHSPVDILGNPCSCCICKLTLTVQVQTPPTSTSSFRSFDHSHIPQRHRRILPSVW